MTSDSRIKREGSIQTFRPDGKKGIRIREHVYDQLCAFILSALDSEEGLTLHELLDKGNLDLPNISDNDVAWYLLQVKLDLEARGLIKVYTPIHQKRLYRIKLTRQGQKKLRTEKKLAGINSTES